MEKPFVLLVDDNEATCTLVTALLHRDFRVDVAGDGLEAVEKLRTGAYSVVLLDLRMPQMDGFGVLDFIDEERPDILSRVLVLTASLSAAEMQRMRPYRVAGIIAKPFEIDTLLNAVRQCAGLPEGRAGGPFLTGGMILLLADLLRQRLM